MAIRRRPKPLARAADRRTTRLLGGQAGRRSDWYRRSAGNTRHRTAARAAARRGDNNPGPESRLCRRRCRHARHRRAIIGLVQNADLLFIEAAFAAADAPLAAERAHLTTVAAGECARRPRAPGRALSLLTSVFRGRRAHAGRDHDCLFRPSGAMSLVKAGRPDVARHTKVIGAPDNSRR